MFVPILASTRLPFLTAYVTELSAAFAPASLYQRIEQGVFQTQDSQHVVAAMVQFH